VNYHVEFRPAAAQQTIGLPDDTYLALIRALGAASRDPLDGTVTLTTPDVHVRRVIFGGVGLASFYIDPQAQLISVFAIVWAGDG
jgi:hypothetical protein